LDVTTQMEYLKLLDDIQHKTGVGIIFVTHDFGIVSKICHRVAVMYAGKIVETGKTADVMQKPVHPYTVALLDAVPKPGSKGTQLSSIEGQPPDPVNLPNCCAFAVRCSRANEKCKQSYPPEVQVGNDRSVSCFRV